MHGKSPNLMVWPSLSSPVLAVIKEWTLAALPIRFREEDFLPDALPYALNQLQEAFPINVVAGGLISYQLRILSLQEHVEAKASLPVESKDFSPQRVASKLHVGMDGII